MAYVLVIVIYWSGAAVTQIEYRTYDACRAAKAQAERMKSHRESECIEKPVQK